MPVLTGAEPFSHDGGQLGVLLCHGFTGSPQGLRPWAQYLADQGFSVRLPRLPGHGTTWQELGRTRWADWYAEAERGLHELAGRCTTVVVGGLSMGGALAIRLAAEHPDEVDGVVLVNIALTLDNPLLFALPVLQHVIPSQPGVVGDIKKPGVTEVGYDRVPLKAMHSFTELWGVALSALPEVTQPLVVYRSAEDHVIPARSTQFVLDRAGSKDVTSVVLEESYHVATLDNDAETIFEGTAALARRIDARQGHSEGDNGETGSESSRPQSAGVPDEH